ncbi:type II toxin-antitoxin system RelE family toxin [Halorubrum sp. FL23]|uniref:type II toxin-antitoxin system RelE family toxin n=1 Tax=Halorubrum sp. FL23 TaxID=3458704 RepID=UPI0040337178
MPRAPDKLRILDIVIAEDLASIQAHNPDHAERILNKIHDWEDKIQWGRVPQEHLTYLTGSGQYNFYRERVGNSGYRVVYEISDGTMTAVAVFPKDDNAYNLDDFRGRMS